MKLRATLIAAVAALALAGQPGCEDTAGTCEDLCAMEAQCQADTNAIPFDETSCRQGCEAFSEADPDFAAGVSDRVECLEEFGQCEFCPIDGT